MARKRIEVPQIETVGAFLSHSPDPTSGDIQSAQIAELHLSKQQPRRYFDAEKLAQLVASVREHGILEPLLVRPLEAGGYELIAGERRLRAAKEVGLTEVPIASREMTDQQALQVALMENLQREDLNPLEETEAILDLLALKLEVSREDVISLLHRSELARRRNQELTHNVMRQLDQVNLMFEELGRLTVNSFRANRLPLLNLPEDVLDSLRQGKLEYTKGQAIARVKDEVQRAKLLEQTIAKNLPLSEIKAKVKELKAETEPTLEQAVGQRWKNLGKQLQKSNAWNDRKKRDRITKLLDELDKLTAHD